MTAAPGADGPPTDVSGALEVVRGRIVSAGGDPERIRVVAVTKGHGPEAVEAALGAGLRDIGENYAQELLGKAAVLAAGSASGRQAEASTGGPRWHFLGSVQRNKVRALAPVVAVWQAVDRLEEARGISAARPGAGVFVEVALAGGPGRAGVAPKDAAALVGAIRQGTDLEIRGLMAVGPPGPPEGAREGFRWLAREARRLGLPEVSMGMSGDLEVAVQEGATLVRVGTALFGPRPGAPGLGR